MEWLYQNKEWLFQGIGVSILTLVAWLIWHYWPTLTRGSVRPSLVGARRPGGQSVAFKRVAPSYLDATETRLWRQMGVESKPSVSSMLSELDTAPLMHKDNRAKELKGVIVSARTKLVRVAQRISYFEEESNKGLVKLTFSIAGGSGTIDCIVKASDYPELQVAKRNDDYWVVGIVEEADPYSVDLRPAVIAKIA